MMKDRPVMLQYLNSDGEWVPAGGPFHSEWTAWVSLGGDDFNYRTVDANDYSIITDRSEVIRDEDN